jgi:hypothetical protein
MNLTYIRIALIHLGGIMLIVACAVVLNVLAWSTTPDAFPDTIWNILVMPSIRIFAGVGSVLCVLYGATSPGTLRLLRMHRRKI